MSLLQWILGVVFIVFGVVTFGFVRYASFAVVMLLTIIVIDGRLPGWATVGVLLLMLNAAVVFVLRADGTMSRRVKWLHAAAGTGIIALGGTIASVVSGWAGIGAALAAFFAAEHLFDQLLWRLKVGRQAEIATGDQ